RLADVVGCDLAALAADRQQRGLVDDVGQVGAGEAGRAVGDVLPVDLTGDGLVAGVDPEDALAAVTVGTLDGDVPVEPAGPAKCWVKDVGAVGRTDDNDAAGDVEAVHLDEQLVEGLLALVRTAGAAAGTTLATGSVELVDEDDRWRSGTDTGEQVADTGRADADERLDELGTRDGEERHLGLAGDGLGEQRLATSGRTEEKQSLGRSGSQRLVLGRVLEIVDDLTQLDDGFVDTAGVFESDLGCALSDPALAQLAEVGDVTDRAAATTPAGSKQKSEDGRKDEEREQEGRDQLQPLLAGLVIGRDHGLAVDELRLQRARQRGARRHV